MPKFRALVDTVYNFQIIRAGKEIIGGDELRKSPNFVCVDGGTVAKTEPAAKNTGENASTYAKALQRGKELGIPKYNRIPQAELLAAIAEAEAKLAAPAPESNAGNDEKAKTDEQNGKTEGAGDSGSTGEDEQTAAGNENTGGNDVK